MISTGNVLRRWKLNLRRPLRQPPGVPTTGKDNLLSGASPTTAIRPCEASNPERRTARSPPARPTNRRLQRCAPQAHGQASLPEHRNNRFWFDVRPNLRREMEDRKRRFTAKEHLLLEVQNRLRGLSMGRPSLAFISLRPVLTYRTTGRCTSSFFLRCPIQPRGWSSGYEGALEILNSRGDQPRMKRNRLLFLAADAESTARLDNSGLLL